MVVLNLFHLLVRWLITLKPKKGIPGVISHVKPVNALFYDIVVDMPG